MLVYTEVWNAYHLLHHILPLALTHWPLNVVSLHPLAKIPGPKLAGMFTQALVALGVCETDYLNLIAYSNVILVRGLL